MKVQSLNGKGYMLTVNGSSYMLDTFTECLRVAYWIKCGII